MLDRFRNRNSRKQKEKKQASSEANYENNEHRKFDDILGYNVETISKDVAASSTAFPNARASVSLLPPSQNETHPTTSVLNEYREINGICPTSAFTVPDKVAGEKVTLDRGKCLLCGRCQEASPRLIKIESAFTPAVRNRERLITSIYNIDSDVPLPSESYEEVGNELKEKIAKTFGRSLAIREVDAGSCNGCEVEITALNNPIYDIERFGIHFVASPRHADMLMVTGPASRNMEIALKRTYEATPEPKLVVAVGACACSGGIFGDTYATTGGIENVIPVDVFIPGCPPRPESLLYGLLLAVDRIKQTK